MGEIWDKFLQFPINLGGSRKHAPTSRMHASTFSALHTIHQQRSARKRAMRFVAFVALAVHSLHVQYRQWHTNTQHSAKLPRRIMHAFITRSQPTADLAMRHACCTALLPIKLSSLNYGRSSRFKIVSFHPHGPMWLHRSHLQCRGQCTCVPWRWRWNRSLWRHTIRLCWSSPPTTKTSQLLLFPGSISSRPRLKPKKLPPKLNGYRLR